MSPDTWSNDLDGADVHARAEATIDAWLAGDAFDDVTDAELSELREAADDDFDFDDSDPGDRYL